MGLWDAENRCGILSLSAVNADYGLQFNGLAECYLAT